MLHPHNNKNHHVHMAAYDREQVRRELSDAIREACGAYDGMPRPHIVWFADGYIGFVTKYKPVTQYVGN